MKLKNVLIVVNDVEKAFYKDLFGLETVVEQKENAVLTEGLVLQEAEIWKSALGSEIIPRNNASELYFEEADFERFAERLEGYGDEIRYVNRLTELPWGQKMIRFYDPDGNLIEVGTPMEKSEEPDDWKAGGRLLLSNLDKLHTTQMGGERIKKNLRLARADVVEYCRDKILASDCNIYKEGKNWYCQTGNIKITVNASSYTIITAHLVK